MEDTQAGTWWTMIRCLLVERIQWRLSLENAAAVYAVVLIMSKLFHLSVREKDSRKKRHLAKCSIKIIGNVLK